VSTPIRILLVEDNAVFREALELLLSLRPAVKVVDSVADGETAIERCRSLAPDVVLLDYRLPGLDGVQATRALRERFPEIAIVCLTAAVSSHEREALLEAGAVACLTKDQELDQIVQAVEQAAGAQQAQGPAPGRRPGA
jgi:DNA-binding NarL/FixJ family response regulator